MCPLLQQYQWQKTLRTFGWFGFVLIIHSEVTMKSVKQPIAGSNAMTVIFPFIRSRFHSHIVSKKMPGNATFIFSSHTQRHMDTHTHTNTNILVFQICLMLDYLVMYSPPLSSLQSSPYALSSEEIVRGWGRWVASASRWGLTIASAVVCSEELLISSLVGISLPQHSRQLAL